MQFRSLRCLFKQAIAYVEPSAGLGDIMLLYSKRLPLVVTFWRAHYDDRNRCTDSVNHRNPIFCEELGSNPEDVLAIDSLHMVYCGPIMRWTAAALWRVILSNPWMFPGADGHVIDLGDRRLQVDILKYFDDAGVPFFVDGVECQ